MRLTLVYIREYPTDVGEIIARILKDLHYTLTGSMADGLIWELAISDCDEHTQTLLECAVSEYVVRGCTTVEVDDATASSYTEGKNTFAPISRLRANSLGVRENMKSMKSMKSI